MRRRCGTKQSVWYSETSFRTKKNSSTLSPHYYCDTCLVLTQFIITASGSICLLEGRPLSEQTCRERSSATFCAWLFSFKTNSSTPADTDGNMLAVKPQSSKPTNRSSTIRTPLGRSIDISFIINYQLDSTKATPTGFYATASGFTLGHRWTPVAGYVNQEGDSLQYHATMKHEWQLLNFYAKTEFETYSGSVSSKQ